MKIERICKFCGKHFYKKPSEIARGRGVFCSKQCLEDFNTSQICQIEGCTNKHYAKGFCQYHYRRSSEVRKRGAESHRRRRPYNIESIRRSAHQQMLKLRMEVLLHYAPNGKLKCANCGYNDIRALELDHINGNGNIHRRKLAPGNKGGGRTIYLDIKRHGFPPEYQVLCRNCNWIKHIENIKDKNGNSHETNLQ